MALRTAVLVLAVGTFDGEGPLRYALQVDGPNADPSLFGELETRARSTIEAADLDPAPTDSRPDIAFRIDVREVGRDETPGLVSTLSVWRRGEAVPELGRTVVCSLCTQGELLQRIDTELEDIVPQIRALAMEAEPRTEPTPAGAAANGAPDPEPGSATAATTRTPPQLPPVTSPEPGDEVEPPPEPSPDPRPEARTRDATPAAPPKPADAGDTGPLGALGKAGSATLGIGLAGAVAGAILIASEPRPLPEDPLYVRNLDPGGYALVGVGTVLTVTGATLLALDIVRRHDRRVVVAARVGRAFGVRIGGVF